MSKSPKVRFAGVVAGGAFVVGGWLLVASLYSRADASPKLVLEPVAHAKYDPAKIDREIAFHEARIRRDPKGAIGWGFLSGAYLARSRESDSDAFAWKAEDAARKSLALRTNRNESAWMKLVQSLLEQHRFRDALAETEKGVTVFTESVPLMREKADILVELGDLDGASAILARLPMTNGGVENAPIAARIAALRGDHDHAIALYQSAMRVVSTNSATPEAGIAWYLTKIATERETKGDLDGARRDYDESLRLFPRSYKAWLGEARLATKRKDYADVLKACDEVGKIAYSLDAVAMRADARKAMGADATKDYAEVRTMYEKEVRLFDGKGKGGPLHVKPIDRQFATFASTHRMYETEALPAAKRDYANRPDEIAKKNLKALAG